MPTRATPTRPYKTHKQRLIARILDNPVYLPNAGMRVSLARALNRLSLNDLANLDIIITLKCQRSPPSGPTKSST
jgi:hypothetical protein